jgi:hypothetical protein
MYCLKLNTEFKIIAINALSTDSRELVRTYGTPPLQYENVYIKILVLNLGTYVLMFFKLIDSFDRAIIFLCQLIRSLRIMFLAFNLNLR